MKKVSFLLAAIVGISFTLTSCSKDDDLKLPDITVNFSATELGLAGDTPTEVTLNLSRVSSSPIGITVTFAEESTVYATDFTISPAAVGKNLTVSIPAGSTSASFSVSKVAGALFEGTEAVKFTIASLSITNGVVIGAKKELTLTFGAIVSAGQTLTLEGKTDVSPYANIVYVDFSSNTQTPVSRKSWDLGFYCGDDFRVILNGAYATTATASTKTDISAVTIADANAALDIAANAMTVEGLSPTVVDTYDGSLTGTAFAAISANDAENKVYFVASEGNKASRDQWYKVKVSRKGQGYTVQYAKVGEATIKSVDIAKNAAYNFAFLSLETGTVVNAEPEGKKWDIAWSYGTAIFGGKPFFMQDIVTTNNIGGAEVAEVMVATVTYADFKNANISALTFSKARDVIASNWRSTQPATGVKTDRFYVVKDPAGNYYKFRFTKMGIANDGGERGRPQVEYAFVK